MQAPQPPLVHREDGSGRPRRSRCATPAIAPAGRARTSSTIVVRHGDDVRRRAPGARREQAAPHPCIPIRRRPPTPLPSRSRRAKRQPIALLSTRSRHRTGRGRRSVLCDPERDAGRDPGCDPAHNSGRNQPRYARAARDRSCRSVQSIRQDAGDSRKGCRHPIAAAARSPSTRDGRFGRLMQLSPATAGVRRIRRLLACQTAVQGSGGPVEPTRGHAERAACTRVPPAARTVPADATTSLATLTRTSQGSLGQDISTPLAGPGPGGSNRGQRVVGYWAQ